jgi:DNA-binding NarL/FixJ family response regulator
MRIVIAEDSVVLRDGLGRLLADAGHEIVASVPDASGLLDAIVEWKPDIAVVDVRMPPTHTDEGLRAAVQIRREHPEVAVLVFSQYVEERYAAELLAGSTKKVGYLLKDRVADVRDFVDAVERVAGGGTALDSEVVSQIFSRSRRRQTLDTLTPRERDVLAAMAEGSSNAAIAARLVVSEGAVEKHISNIFAKLGLSPSESEHRRVLAVLTYLGTS